MDFKTRKPQNRTKQSDNGVEFLGQLLYRNHVLKLDNKMKLMSTPLRGNLSSNLLQLKTQLLMIIYISHQSQNKSYAKTTCSDKWNTSCLYHLKQLRY